MEALGEASSRDFEKQAVGSFGGTEPIDCTQSRATLRAADRRPEGAWGSLPGRSAARIIVFKGRER